MFLEDLEKETKPHKQQPIRLETEYESPKSLPTASEMWSEFVNGTSLHGIRYVFLRRPLWARIGWLLILLAFTGYFLFSAYESLTKFFRYPINTVITQKYLSELELPAITICPINVISRKKLFALDGDKSFVKYALEEAVCNATSSVRAGKACGAAMLCCCVNFFLFDGSKLSPGCTTEYKQALLKAQLDAGVYFNGSLFYQTYGQSIEEMLDSGLCVFGGALYTPCTAQDFSTSVTDFGVCHTFNSGHNGEESVKKTTIAGPGGGLNILLNANVDDHFIGRLSEGFSVIIHRPGEFFTAWDGINVGPGMLATIHLHQQRVCSSNGTDSTFLS